MFCVEDTGIVGGLALWSRLGHLQGQLREGGEQKGRLGGILRRVSLIALCLTGTIPAPIFELLLHRRQINIGLLVPGARIRGTC